MTIRHDMPADNAALEARNPHVKLLTSGYAGILAEYEKKLEVGVWMVSALTHDVYWSAGIYHLHDLEVGLPVGLESGLSYYAPEDQERVRSLVEDALLNEKGFEFTAMLVGETGRRKRVHSLGDYRIIDGIPMLVGIFRQLHEEGVDAAA